MRRLRSNTLTYLAELKLSRIKDCYLGEANPDLAKTTWLCSSLPAECLSDVNGSSTLDEKQQSTVLFHLSNKGTTLILHTNGITLI